jgi:hypothetical protein
MKRVGILACILFIGVGVQAGLAQALSVDWKFYGGASVMEDSEYCFYDAEGVAPKPDAHILVWTKCLPQKDIEAIDIEKEFDGRILKNSAEKVAHYYVPPIATIENIDVNQRMAVTQYEETANISNIQPRARILYEFNCSERMLRELSIYVQANGKIGSRDKPNDWRHIPPEGNGASLLKILCQRR